MSSDEPTEPTDIDELPPALRQMVESLRSGSETTGRIAVWIPTLVAAWRAGRRGMAVSSALRERVESDEPLEWPAEAVDEFGETLGEIADALPGFDEAVPATSELVDAGREAVDGEVAAEMLLELLDRLEKMAGKALIVLVETAFFAPEPEDPAQRNRVLRRLFERLEELFDRLLYLWLFDDSQPGKTS